VANESILISEVIPATPQRIFSAWLDSAEHSAFSGSEAVVDPAVGGEHRAADGYIRGRTLELNDGSRIVQSWRTTEFPADSPDSRLEITLEPTLGGTLVTLLHTDIPSGQSDRYREGWNEYYLSRMKQYFAEGGGVPQEVLPEETEANGVPPKPRTSRQTTRDLHRPAIKTKAKAKVTIKAKAKTKTKTKTKAKPKAQVKAKAAAAKTKARPKAKAARFARAAKPRAKAKAARKPAKKKNVKTSAARRGGSKKKGKSSARSGRR
jgi:uncharacterized protein YndB with AHSA1/START domain